jgi:diguanylate cyclase (GGDEF)-like protein
MSSRSREQVTKIMTPLAAAIAGAGVGSVLRGRKERQQSRVALRFVKAANARAERAEEKAIEAKKESRKDSLTGLYNRLGLREAFDYLAERPNSEKGKNSLIALDLDNFKQINDGEGGHAAGNEVLRNVAAILLKSSRPGDTIARIGGDEMVMMLPRADQEIAAEVAERTRAAIEATGQVTASFGVASINPMFSMEDNLKCADAALYAAKDNARNQVVIYSSQTPAVG